MTFFNNSKTFIIAEIGMNHNGQLDIAKKSIIEAAKAGAHAVKFQTFKTENFLSTNYFHPKDFNERKKHELSLEELLILKKISDDIGIIFFSTPFDEISLDILNKVGVQLFKIASADINNWPLIRKICEQNKPLIISTGYSEISEIKKIYNEITKINQNPLGIMHCVAKYPTDLKDINLENIQVFRKLFKNSIVGISDHTKDVEIIPLSAYLMGARIFEKHFTLDNSFDGYDHKISLNPKDFSTMVDKINLAELIRGKSRSETGVLDCEIERKETARRSIYLKNSKLKDQLLDEDDLVALRPGTGISVEFWDQIIGKKVKKNLNKGYQLNWTDVSE